ncbi:hypothetical protein VKT23_011946 [Stygiomarasmius scandens]|uniref:Uncharacterized protein n=1 Tax=Marasmiellus scandens TaxID=2682957 RepID=A0ABR1J8D6_9AGAR
MPLPNTDKTQHGRIRNPPRARRKEYQRHCDKEKNHDLSREVRRSVAGSVGGNAVTVDKVEGKVGVSNEGEDGRVGGGVSLCAASDGEVGGEE